jgi:hypothetical protein
LDKSGVIGKVDWLEATCRIAQTIGFATAGHLLDLLGVEGSEKVLR